MRDNKKKAPYMTKSSLILRIIVSGYLLYTVYSLAAEVPGVSGNEKIFVIIAIVFFAVIAIPLGILSVKSLLYGEYARPGEKQEIETEQETDKEIETEQETDSTKEPEKDIK